MQSNKTKPIKILFLPNWKVSRLELDSQSIQSPDKIVAGIPYWFFRYFVNLPDVDVLDKSSAGPFRLLEKITRIYFYQSLKAYVSCKKYDVIISHGAQSGLVYSLLNSLPGRRKRPKHVIFDIGGMNGARKNIFECLLIRIALASKPGIICHSSCLLKFYQRTYPSIFPSARFIPFGVDVNDFKPIKCPVKRQILSFGYSKRDYATLLKAWENIDSDVTLKIIGLKNVNNEAEHVSILDGVSLTELRKEIAQSLFIVIPLPYFKYSYGQMSFLQSLSMGKFTIVTYTPSSSDYLKDGLGAKFVPVGDDQQLAAEIQKALKDENLLEKQGHTARAYVESNCSEKTMAKHIESYLRNLTKRGSH